MSKASRSLSVALLTGALWAPGVAGAGAQVHVESNSIVRFFEQEGPDGEDKHGVPGYEYLQFDAGELQGDGFSFHAYGWGRHDFGDFFEDESAGEVLYGYLQYALSANNVLIRAGRQSVFEGVANEALDGLRLSSDLTPFFTVSAYGGQPVSLEEVNGRSGDRLWGGRLANHLLGYYDLGVSYKRVVDDGDKQEEFLGIDSSVTPPGPVSLFGYSTRNLVSDSWAEHSYEARISIAKIGLRPFFQRFRYDGFFDTGRNTATPFRFLRDTQEQVTVAGAGATWTPTKALELGAMAKHYDYKESDVAAWYYAGLATLHVQGISQLGAEVGRMNGDTEENRYTLARGFLYWEQATLFASGDLVYVKYDQDIYEKGDSFFASLGCGIKLLANSLALKVSGDYSSDPYFDSDYRGTVSAQYVFDAK